MMGWYEPGNDERNVRISDVRHQVRVQSMSDAKCAQSVENPEVALFRINDARRTLFPYHSIAT